MRIATLYGQRRPLFSVELYPPRTPSGVDNLKAKLVEICAHEPDFISVTYGAGGGTRHTTLEICSTIKNELRTEVMAHLTCAAHTREEIGEVLTGLREAHVENIMALRGDPPQGAERFKPPAGGFRYAIELVRELRAVRGFGIGVAGYPEGHVEAPDYRTDLARQIEKIEAGGEFIVSQFFLDNGHFLRWREQLRRAGVRVPIVAGILPALSAGQITRFAKLCGVAVPSTLVAGLQRFEHHPESAAAFGLVYAVRQIEALLREDLDGLHLYALNRLESIRIVSALVRSAALTARARAAPGGHGG